MTWGGTPPRVWAARVLEGTVKLDDVPELCRGITEAHLFIAAEQKAMAIRKLATRQERVAALEQCPAAIRDAVAAKVIEYFSKKTVAP